MLRKFSRFKRPESERLHRQEITPAQPPPRPSPVLFPVVGAPAGFGHQRPGLADRQIAAGDDDLPHVHQVFEKQILPLQQQTVRRQGGDHSLTADELKTLQRTFMLSPAAARHRLTPPAVQHRQHVILRRRQHFDVEQRVTLGKHLDRCQQAAPVDIRDHANRQLAFQPQRQLHRVHLQLLSCSAISRAWGTSELAMAVGWGSR